MKINPFFILATLIAAVLIGISSATHRQGHDALRTQFAHHVPPNVSLLDALPPVDLPTMLQQAIERAREGEHVLLPVEPNGSNEHVHVRVTSLLPRAEGLRVTGIVTNIGNIPLTVSVNDFELRDSDGQSYIANESRHMVLEPGQSTSLQLDVSLPSGRGLSLITRIPAHHPIEQLLIRPSPPSS